jgi:ubiquinone/menaquinone biosynthesis C-methylase UbiE
MELLRASAYDAHTFNINFEREAKRLTAQVDLFWDGDRTFFLKQIPQTPIALLDIGCGTGRLLQHLEPVFPHAFCIGVDADVSLCTMARKNLKIPLRKLCLACSSVYSLSFSSKTFDVVIARLLLEHLSDPSVALHEIFRILKIGGKAIIIDNDFDFHLRTWPPIDEFDEYYNAYCMAREQAGGNPKIGRQLPRFLKQAGFSEIAFEMYCAFNYKTGNDLFLQSEGQGIPDNLVRMGFLKRDSLYSLKKKWAVMLRTPGHTIVRPLFYAIGIKSTPQT